MTKRDEQFASMPSEIRETWEEYAIACVEAAVGLRGVP